MLLAEVFVHGTTFGPGRLKAPPQPGGEAPGMYSNEKTRETESPHIPTTLVVGFVVHGQVGKKSHGN